MSPEPGLRHFVHALSKGAIALRRGDHYVVAGSGPRAPQDRVAELVSAGALDGDGVSCRANGVTRFWLRRAHLDGDAFASQHRIVTGSPDGVEFNVAESPLARLAVASGSSAPFLEPHHIEAGERVRRLVERAQLQPHVTMRYSPSPPAKTGVRGAAEISDLAADARRAVASIHRRLPPDCAGVVIDVCGLLKGLQQVERERGWPRRSAKLVLRIGLDQLAQQYGLGSVARGPVTGPQQAWMEPGARPSMFG